MPTECIKMSASMQFRDILHDRGHDFWVGFQSNVSADETVERMHVYRVEGELVSDIFSHCYVKEASDVRKEAIAILDEFGSGLRRKRALTPSVPGCIFVFVNEGGPSVLSRWYSSMDDKDRRLSAEERVRRERHMFEIVSLVEMEKEMSRNKNNFWLTSYSFIDAETCKRRVVTSSVEGQNACERFSRCLITEVADCHKATERLSIRKGLGLRKNAVRSKFGQGCLALLLTSPASSKTGVKRSHGESATHASSSTDAAVSTEIKRRNGSSTDQTPLSTNVSLATVAVHHDEGQRCEVVAMAGERRTASPDISELEGRTDRADTADVNVMTSPPSPEDDLFCKQMQVLENRIAKLLPSLSEDQFSTDYIQERLEEIMQKPKGRLDPFKTDIGRIWQSWVDVF
eukprot:TRINITY_DN35535_c0_g1_i1.p1 TRINITY_DN35535_c0_g1~~TRINITY_DN35535_c0_g1_i1.p1  ORF type:complete len:401 (+),score=55.46 TRINITY_DN35535_c0_g1_i1:139-1341(+)